MKPTPSTPMTFAQFLGIPEDDTLSHDIISAGEAEVGPQECCIVDGRLYLTLSGLLRHLSMIPTGQVVGVAPGAVWVFRIPDCLPVPAAWLGDVDKAHLSAANPMTVS